MILFPGLLKGHHQTELPELPLDLVVFFFIKVPGTLWNVSSYLQGFLFHQCGLKNTKLSILRG